MTSPRFRSSREYDEDTKDLAVKSGVGESNFLVIDFHENPMGILCLQFLCGLGAVWSPPCLVWGRVGRGDARGMGRTDGRYMAA